MADPWLLALCVGGPVMLWILRHESPEEPPERRSPRLAVFLVAKASRGRCGVLRLLRRTGRDPGKQWRRAIDRSEVGEPRHLARLRPDTDTFASVARDDGRSGGRDAVLAARQRDSSDPDLPIVLDRSQFPPRAPDGLSVIIPDVEGGTLVFWSDIRFCWDPAGPHAAGDRANRAVPGWTPAAFVRVVVWRRARCGRPASPRDRQGRRIQAGARDREVSTNSTFAKGVPSPVALGSTSNPSPLEAAPSTRRAF